MISLWKTLCSPSLRHSLKAIPLVVCFVFVVTYSLHVTQDGVLPTDVVNGEVNKLFLTIENKTGKNVTLHSVAGEFLDPASETLIKAVRAFDTIFEI
jgi:hypothetical protein